MAGAAKFLAKSVFVSKRIDFLWNCSSYFINLPTQITTSKIYFSRSLSDYKGLSPVIPSLQPLRYNIYNSKRLWLKQLDLCKGCPKTFFSRRKRDQNPNDTSKKRVPKLILVQNPLTWIMIKIDFGVLKTLWDPSFAEKDFKFGTKQAISRVTQVISDGEYGDLNGLLTKAARLALIRELTRNWGERERSLLALDRDDIQISSPRKVYFIRIADKRFCDVDMAFLALKWAPINSIDSLIFAEIFARFHREYTPHCIPEWTIAYFKVTRFQVLRRRN